MRARAKAPRAWALYSTDRCIHRTALSRSWAGGSCASAGPASPTVTTRARIESHRPDLRVSIVAIMRVLPCARGPAAAPRRVRYRPSPTSPPAIGDSTPSAARPCPEVTTRPLTLTRGPGYIGVRARPAARRESVSGRQPAKEGRHAWKAHAIARDRFPEAPGAELAPAGKTGSRT